MPGYWSDAKDLWGEMKKEQADSMAALVMAKEMSKYNKLGTIKYSYKSYENDAVVGVDEKLA